MNQCQGCQAGWEKFTHKPWPKGSKGIEMHRDNNGGLVVCSEHRYKQK